ncbi:MAG: 4Fe-4S binding protein [Pirellulales bacterium]
MSARRLALGLASLLSGLAALLAAGTENWASGDPWRPLAAVCGAALLATGVAALSAARSRGRSDALWRWDHFLPFLRKPRKGTTPRPPSWVYRWTVGRLPASWLSDVATARPGRLRRFLRKLGPTWAAAPLRRCVQAFCLVAFLLLLHYVCWPYSARPAPPAQRWRSPAIVGFDQATGRLTLSPPADPSSAPRVGDVVYASSAAADSAAVAVASDDQRPLDAFVVESRNDSAWVLQPRGELSDELLDLALTGGECELFDRDPRAWPSHYADELARKERVAAELFLVIDPLVSLSTAIASRSWVWSLASAAAILLACVFIPRGFCGYLCPLGTVIDLFDYAIGRRVTRLRVADDGWWVHIKYYLLAGTLVAALGGVLVSGFCAAIPVVTRGCLFLGDPLQTSVARGGHLIPPFNAGHGLSIGLFLAVLGLGFLQPRFWCKYVCPSGAVFSLGNLLRVSERKVEDTCIHCNKCVEICPFDAIKPDFTTRTTDCTLCQTCGGVCPTEAIKFVDRWNLVQIKLENDPPTGETPLGRRGFLSLAAGAAASLAGGVAAVGAARVSGARLDDPDARRPVRPPGSLPEREFLQACIRCGECFKACPNNVLQPLAFEQGWEGLWTPQVVADWAGCESSCNACGQVCPTGAIRALPLEEKRVARMGLAILNESTCLPLAGREACQLCVDECHAAGYHALEFTQVHTQVSDDGTPIEGSGFLAPVVIADRCVGCGLCQTRCFGINVDQKHLLTSSAIVIEAGGDREDRLLHGSYRALRAAERRARDEQRRDSPTAPAPADYLPDFLQ